MASASAIKRYDKDWQPDAPHYQRASATLLAATPEEQQAPQKTYPHWPEMYQHFEARWGALYNWRLTWWNEWAEIARYMLPRHYHYFITPNVYDKGRRRDYNIVDETATFSGQTCSRGLFTGMTDPDRPWLKLGPGIPGFELDRAGQIWYDELTERYRYVLQESNFYDSQAMACDDVTFFGNAPVIDYEDEEQILRCYNPIPGEYCLGAASDFTTDTFYREFNLTVSQIVEMFGLEKVPDDVAGLWRQKGSALENEFVIRHGIEPNFPIAGDNGEAVGVIPGGFTWREVYWMAGKATDGPLSVAGFHERPFAVNQWDRVSNNAYAWGPGTVALGGTIQLQFQTRQFNTALLKVVDPPMGADSALANMPYSTNPGQTTFMNTATQGKQSYWPLYEIRPDLKAMADVISQVQTRIGRAFFNDIFRVIENLQAQRRDITATEVDALKEERLMQLGSVIGRIYNEGLRPRVRRHLRIMARRGLIPPKPKSLRGVPLKIEFISMLTMAQRASATVSIQQLLAFIGNAAPLYPEAKYAVDPMEMVRELGQLRGVPAKIMRAPKEAQRMAQQEAQTKQGMQTVQAGVDAAKNLSQASLAGPSALSALLGRQT